MKLAMKALMDKVANSCVGYSELRRSTEKYMVVRFGAGYVICGVLIQKGHCNVSGTGQEVVKNEEWSFWEELRRNWRKSRVFSLERPLRPGAPAQTGAPAQPQSTRSEPESGIPLTFHSRSTHIPFTFHSHSTHA